MSTQDALMSLKVHRVVSSNTSSLDFLEANEKEQFFSQDGVEMGQELCEEYRSDWQFLPRQYAQIYLGEMLSFYACLTNDSIASPVKNVSLRIDLQVTSRVINLCDITKDQMECKESHNMLIHHEVKEMGANVLICTISYQNSMSNSNPNSPEVSSFRKFFKFHVEKPLDVKTKFYNAESDEVYLEALLENLTNLPMRLDSVKLEPSQYFDVKSMNTIVDAEDGSERWIFGPVNRFNPSEFRQYLFCLTPKQDIRLNVKLLKTVTVIGKLDIMWTSGVGSKGHLQTSHLERMGPVYSDVRISLLSIPGTVTLKQKFNFIIKITNCSESEIEPHVYFDNLMKNPAILWLGISGRSLGSLPPGHSVDVHLTCYPIKSGLWPIPKLKITDGNSKNSYNFEEIAYVFVNEVDAPDEAVISNELGSLRIKDSMN